MASSQLYLEENLLISLPSEVLCEIVKLLDRNSIRQLTLTNKALKLKLETLYWQPLFKKCFPMVELAEGVSYFKAFYLRYNNAFNQLSKIDAGETLPALPPGGMRLSNEVDEEKSRQILQMFNSGTITPGLFVDKECIDDVANYCRRPFLALISNSSPSPEIGVFLNEYYWQPLYEKCFPKGGLAKDETYASAFMRSFNLITFKIEKRKYFYNISYLDWIRSGEITKGLLDDKEFMSIIIYFDPNGFKYASEKLQKDLFLAQLTIFESRCTFPLDYIAKIFKGDVVIESGLKNIEKGHNDLLSTGSPLQNSCRPYSEFPGWVKKYFPPVAQPSARVETPQPLGGEVGKQEVAVVAVVEGREIQEPSSGISSVGMFGSTAARGDDQGGPCPKDDKTSSPSSLS